MIRAISRSPRRAVVHTSGPNLRLATLGIANRQANQSGFIPQLLPTQHQDSHAPALRKPCWIPFIREDHTVERLKASTAPTAALLHRAFDVAAGRGTVRAFDWLDDSSLDMVKLRRLMEDAFQRQLKPTYLDDVRGKIIRIYVAGWDREEYDGCAIVTDEDVGVPYLDKFAVAGAAQGIGAGGTLWRAMRRDQPGLFWRSRSDNKLNAWYFGQANGSLKMNPEWFVSTVGCKHSFTTFWVHGSDGEEGFNCPTAEAELQLLQQFLDVTQRKPESFLSRTESMPP